MLVVICCNHGVSAAGSKQTLLQRVLQHYGKLPVVQPLHSEPNADERVLHEINHLSYAAWCEACLVAKGRTDFIEQTQNI